MKHTTKAGNVNRPMRTIQQFFTDSKDLGVIRAEALFTEHNLPLACADHTGPLFRKMFPDSTIATKYLHKNPT